MNARIERSETCLEREKGWVTSEIWSCRRTRRGDVSAVPVAESTTRDPSPRCLEVGHPNAVTALLESDSTIGVARGMNAVIDEDHVTVHFDAYAIVGARDDAVDAVSRDVDEPFEEQRETFAAYPRTKLTLDAGERDARQPPTSLGHELLEVGELAEVALEIFVEHTFFDRRHLQRRTRLLLHEAESTTSLMRPPGKNVAAAIIVVSRTSIGASNAAEAVDGTEPSLVQRTTASGKMRGRAIVTLAVSVKTRRARRPSGGI